MTEILRTNRPQLTMPIIFGEPTFFNAETATVVGVAGSASTLPSNPSGYMKVIIDGTEYVIPYYGVNSGVTTESLKPAFLVTNGTGALNVTGDGTVYTVLWPTEVYDQVSNFASNTFTAPVTGKYILTASVGLEGILNTHTHCELRIVTSNRTYEQHIHLGVAVPDISINTSVVADMDINDTAYVTINVDGSTKVVDVVADATNNYFSGYLLV